MPLKNETLIDEYHPNVRVQDEVVESSSSRSRSTVAIYSAKGSLARLVIATSSLPKLAPVLRRPLPRVVSWPSTISSC